MYIAFTIHRDDLTRALQDFLPMRLLIGKLAETTDPPWVQIDALEGTDFVPGRGVRVTCAAKIHFPLPLLPDDFTVQNAVFEMAPAILSGPDGPVLAFTLALQDLDLANLPAFVDRAVLKRVNALLIEYASTIAWNFSKTLTRTAQLPKRLHLVHRVTLSGPSGVVTVTEESIVAQLAVDVSFQHGLDPAAESPSPEGPS